MTLRNRALLVFALVAGLGLYGETQLRMSLRSEPRTLDPLLVEDDASELIRYISAGVLVRVDRPTQELRGELATSWKLSRDARQLTLQLRKDVRFSDGSPFDSADVLHTFKLLFAPGVHSAVGDTFRTDGKPPRATAKGPSEVTITFAGPTASAPRLLDQLPILSSRADPAKRAVSGPFQIAEHKPGSWLLLRKNPYYWKRDSAGRQLPYLDSIRISIMPNREMQALAFRRSEIDLIENMDARTFEDLAKTMPREVVDIGPGLDSEFLWFNQVPSAKIAEEKKQWFRQTEFRRAVSMTINRPDLARIAFRGHAVPAASTYPAANKLFFNPALKPHTPDAAVALKLLEKAGFVLKEGTLRDRTGKPVTFSLLTNAGNHVREQEAALIQRDLKAIGIQINIVTLDFPALLERIIRTYEYDVCLAGLVNTDPDPNGVMNVFLSSGTSHQWNPKQATPQTTWEAAMDKLMLAQASAATEAKRRAAFNGVQEIMAEQEPFVYLVHPNVMTAVSANVRSARPTTLSPFVLWNIEFLDLVSKRPTS